MQKILFVITKSNWGGAQRYVFDLASALPKKEWQVAVAMGGTGLLGAPTGKLEEELRHNDIRTIVVPSFIRDISLRTEWRVLRELWDLFAQEQPNIVHLNSSKAGGLGALAARLAGVPHIVFTSHGLAYDEDRNVAPKALIWLATWTTFLLSHRVIVMSQNTYERVKRLPFCSKKVSLVYNGIPVLNYLSRKEARIALALPKDVLVIGALGELTWNKNYHTLIRAVAELKRSGREFLLCIIGDGEERQFIETLIQENDLKNQVSLAGFLPEGYKYLKAFDLFTLPSTKEGLPYVLLEAAQAGLPVVGSRIPGIIDVIGEGAGILAAVKNEKELCEAFAALLDDPSKRERLGTALRQRATDTFSLHSMVEQTIKVYAS